MFPVPVPVPGVVVVTVMNAGPTPFANVNACPSASVAETTWFAVAFSATVIAATVPTNTGAWFTLVTVIVNVLLVVVAVPSVTVTVLPGYEPDCVKFGARL